MRFGRGDRIFFKLYKRKFNGIVLGIIEADTSVEVLGIIHLYEDGVVVTNKKVVSKIHTPISPHDRYLIAVPKGKKVHMHAPLVERVDKNAIKSNINVPSFLGDFQ